MRVLRLAAVVLLAVVSLPAQNPVPLINQPLVPASAAPGGKGFTLTVNGTGFVSTSSVEWNGQSLVTTVVSSKKLKATVPSANIAKAGTASVTVVNPGAAASNAVYFPVVNAETNIGFARTDISGFTSSAGSVAGDFNNDGKQDVAISTSGGIDILLGNGDGTFGDAIFNGNGTTTFLAAGDFNNDGNLDLAAQSPGELEIWVGSGDGTITLASSFFTNSGTGIALGDFNGDGHLDVALSEDAFFGGSCLAIFLGNGDGTLSFGADYPLEGTGAAAVGDFNGDGKLDLAVPSHIPSSSVMTVFLGNGDGTFLQSTATYPVLSFPPAAISVDLNGDNKLDLAVANVVGDAVSVLLGNGDGTFGASVSYPVSGGSESIVLGDFNGDGKADLAVADGATISLLVGNGDGTFQTRLDYDTGGTAVSLTAADFNNDGRMDIITANSSSNSVSVFLQSTANVTPPSLTFSDQNVGSPSPSQDVTLTNSATTALNISSITFTGTNPTDFSETNTCGTSLAGGASCTISVTFTPTATGPRSATLNVNDDAAGSPQTVSLSGTGTAPVVSLSTANLTFASQLVGTRSPTQQVTMSNTGTGTLTISAIAVTGDYLQQNTCGSTLAIGASCAITLQFFPRQKGIRTGTLTITDDASGSPQTVALNGTGTIVKLSAIGINFGDQAVGTTSPAATVTLTNTSGQALTVAGIGIRGPNASDFAQTNNCGTSVAGHGSCTIRITFTPTALGARSAALSISDNGGGSPQTVALTGTGT